MTGDLFQKIASIIADSEAILIGAGAGMGVDSGLPDFRGNEGFWRAYPPFRELGLSFVDLANPFWFERDPNRAWGFYGHRLNLYRETRPHEGFEILRQWCKQRDHFVFTSNVDGHFQKAGFDDDRIVECHGSIGHLQCKGPCHRSIWRNRETTIVDEGTMLAQGELPRCPNCESVARPNILMFGDHGWISSRTAEQEIRYREFIQRNLNKRLVVLEFGAGSAVPTVRFECERMRPMLIRVNPREADVPDQQSIGVSSGALEFVKNVDRIL